jgi:hypothetical protein
MTLRHSITDTFPQASARQHPLLDCEPTDPRVLRVDLEGNGEGQMTVCVPAVKRLDDFDCGVSPVSPVSPATVAALVEDHVNM